MENSKTECLQKEKERVRIMKVYLAGESVKEIEKYRKKPLERTLVSYFYLRKNKDGRERFLGEKQKEGKK